MSDLDLLLDQAVGEVEPSFDLDDVTARGVVKRRTVRGRALLSGVAVAMALVAIVPLIGNRTEFVTSPDLATQVDDPEPPAPRFVKPGENSTALLHMPSIFDTEPLPRTAWPIEVERQLPETAEVWPSPVPRQFVSLDMTTQQICLLEPDRIDKAITCHPLNQLALSAWLDSSPQPTSALVAFEAEGDALSRALSELGGGTVSGGFVVFDQPVRQPDLSTLPQSMPATTPSEVDVQMTIDGVDLSVAAPRIVSCVRTDGAIQVSLRDRRGALVVTSSTNDGSTLSDIEHVWHRGAVLNGASIQPAELLIFMNPDVTEDEVAAIEAELQRETTRELYELIDQEAAFAEFQMMFEGEDAILDSVTVQDMPTSFRLQGLADDATVELLTDLNGLDGILQVVSNAGDVLSDAGALPMLDPGPRAIVHALDENGPVVYAAYGSEEHDVELLIRCGTDHLDARTSVAAASPTPASSIEPLEAGEWLGRMAIPAIDTWVDISYGVDAETLRKGPGSYPSTSIPGLTGNAAIAGHRTTYGAPFGDVDQLEPDDVIVVSTVDGDFIYLVTTTEIVEPSAVEVLDDHGDNRLTLTSHHPRYSARERIVVSAELVGEPRQIDSALPIDAAPESLD